MRGMIEEIAHNAEYFPCSIDDLKPDQIGPVIFILWQFQEISPAHEHPPALQRKRSLAFGAFSELRNQGVVARCIRLHLDPSPYAVRAGNPADLNEAIPACSSCVQSPVSGTQTSDEAAALRACFTRRATVSDNCTPVFFQ